jgi:4-oxalocrotonate tautomerase
LDADPPAQGVNIAGRMTQKKQMIEKLTDAMVSIEGENMRSVTWVKISEVTSGEWGIGGQPLTTEAVKALAAGKKAA